MYKLKIQIKLYVYVTNLKTLNFFSLNLIRSDDTRVTNTFLPKNRST